MELLLHEMVQHSLDPTRTVACVLELPRGKGAPLKTSPHFLDDLKITFEMILGAGLKTR